MSISEWPCRERPREKLAARGATFLSDYELIAIFLRTGYRGVTAVELAGELLAHFGGLRAMLDADVSQLTSRPGMGPAKAAQLHAVVELAQRQLAEQLEHGEALTRPEMTKKFLVRRLRGSRREIFCCMFLSSQHHMLACEDLFMGTIDGAAVYPREVVVRALHHNAAAVIFAHNHPSGVAEPSQADLRITRRLTEALGLVDIRVLDHVIVGDAEPLSFAENGLL
ncbi:MAG: DNA repair protein RadC [Halieaceae bacterium]|jgi:DNA repair protein RadC